MSTSSNKPGNKHTGRFEPIAIVGQSCVLPGALNPDELWQAVRQGKSLISEASENDWGQNNADFLANAGESSESIPKDKSWNSMGGRVEGFESIFDPDAFNLDAELVKGLDPTFQWLLHTGREALKSIKVMPKTGAIIGNLSYPNRSFNKVAQQHWFSSINDKRQGDSNLNGKNETVNPINRFMSGYPAQLLSNALGLTGPSYCVDAACASSLYAIKLACDALHSRDADMMLAGGVNGIDDLFLHVGFTALSALSPTGKSRPFHQDADGLIPATGAALITLKRLEDAEAAGDEILGVIRGIGLSNDGQEGGLLAPSSAGQIAAMQSAYDQSGISPEEISLLECHATGTQVGDTTELESLKSVYQGCKEVPVGSLKSNLGHLVTAAGAAGILKVLGAMKAGERPATINANQPLSIFEASPFRLLNQTEAWNVPGSRKAAVSAFGFGGNNAHIILESYDPRLQSYDTKAQSKGLLKASTVNNKVTKRKPVAIVGIGLQVADLVGTEEFTHHWFSGQSRLKKNSQGELEAKAEKITLDSIAIGISPNDLKQIHGQQLMMMAVSNEALAQVENINPKRTGAFIGMGADSEVTRYYSRLKAADLYNKDAIIPPLNATRTLGCMPNVPANRLNVIYDFKGPSFTFSSEELSGIDALKAAIYSLSQNEIETAIVGAVDLSCDEIHQLAASQCLPSDKQNAGDAAVALVLKTLEQAKIDGDQILAVIDDQIEEAGTGTQTVDGQALSNLFGHAHAASGLLQVAAGALAVAHNASPSETAGEGLGRTKGKAIPKLSGYQQVNVEVESFSGHRDQVQLSSYKNQTHLALHHKKAPTVYLFVAKDKHQLVKNIKDEIVVQLSARDQSQSEQTGDVKLAIVANSDEDFQLKKQQALVLLERGNRGKHYTLMVGIYYAEKALKGKLAFTFPSSAGSYSGMGQDLLLAYPELVQELQSKLKRPGSISNAAAWIYDSNVTDATVSLFEKLKGALFLSQIHSQFSHEVLGLKPEAYIGFSAGETAALFASGAWRDLDAYYQAVDDSGMWTKELAGELNVLNKAWSDTPNVAKTWRNWGVRAPYEAVKSALEKEPLVHLATINIQGDYSICGQEEACERVVDAIGRANCQPIHYDLIHHCPEIEAYKNEWQVLNTREVVNDSVRLYGTANSGAGYSPSQEKVKQALLGMAQNTVDYPEIINSAYDDGIEIFLEHGARSSCSSYINKILEGKDHLAVSLDAFGSNDLQKIAETVAQLFVVGVDVNVDALFTNHQKTQARQNQDAENIQKTPQKSLMMSFPAHEPEVKVKLNQTRIVKNLNELDKGIETTMAGSKEQYMPKAPQLPGALSMIQTLHQNEKIKQHPAGSNLQTVSNLEAVYNPQTNQTIEANVDQQPKKADQIENIEPVMATSLIEVDDHRATEAVSYGAQIAKYHQQYLSMQTQVHKKFLKMQQNTLFALSSGLTSGMTTSRVATEQATTVAQLKEPISAALSSGSDVSMMQTSVAQLSASSIEAPNTVDEAEAETPVLSVVAEKHIPEKRIAEQKAPKNSKQDKQLEPVGPSFSRAQLKVHAEGKISDIFGELFKQQDNYPVQVRMPTEPMLLADRVTGIDADPGSLKLGTVWTETDITDDAWYLHQGHIPPGIMIESGQADLFLISYLGIDFKNKGDRAYRLLGCEVTYTDDLPRPGDTLKFDIHIDSHAVDGDIHLFFFHYDCYVGDRQVLKVRNGQAGFFNKEELSASKGVLWNATEVELEAEPRLDKATVECKKTSFSRQELNAFAAGDLKNCFGDEFGVANTHTRTPTIAAGKELLMDEVSHFVQQGGPWGRGYLRASRKISSDDWFFDGHFKNDPCMPGTLMTDMAFQGMSVYLTASGYTLNKDGWTFAPVTNESVKLECRSQVLPTSKELILEIFVREIIAGPEPTIYADVISTVDGMKALYAERIHLRLMTDYPNAPRELIGDDAGEPVQTGQRYKHFKLGAADGTSQATKAVALVDGIPCDEKQASDCAWGKPSEAFGSRFKSFDHGKRLARLPGEPYLFISRILETEGEYCGMKKGSKAIAEWDVPDDCVFFSENGYPTLPYCVIQEAVLQPCGWLGCFIGCPLEYDTELFFRNLDGTLNLYKECIPAGSTIRTEVENTSLAKSGGTIILSFKVEAYLVTHAKEGDANEGDASVEDEKLLDMTTVFGYFSGETMAVQVGLAPKEGEPLQLEAPSSYSLDLSEKPSKFCAGSLKLASEKLLMTDRISGYWPKGGNKSLGRVRGEKTINTEEWFFKAHFFQDPVQPGSLGLEPMLQLLQFYMIENNMGDSKQNPRFEPITLGTPISWRYRGQVIPSSKLVHIIVDIVEVGENDRGPYVIGEASLWCDGLKIYDAKNIGMCIVESDKLNAEPDDTASGSNSNTAGAVSTLTGFTKEQLQEHATGKLAKVFGESYASIDSYAFRSRLPATPFLLLDRVVNISDGEQASIEVEWDLKQDAWYLDSQPDDPLDSLPGKSRVNSALLLEAAGQASIFLCTALGEDFNGRDRVYRILSTAGIRFYGNVDQKQADSVDQKLTDNADQQHIDLPLAGETLSYRVSLKRRYNQGASTFFFFKYQCYRQGKLLVEVEDAIATLIPRDELSSAKGVSWTPSNLEKGQLKQGVMEQGVLEQGLREKPLVPPVSPKRHRFSREQVDCLANGDAYGCFGSDFETLKGQRKSPKISSGLALQIDEVLELDTQGGPGHQGYMKAIKHLLPDEWFFKAHFKNDPCMPAALIGAGCFQALGFYLSACGLTLGKDDYIFVPMANRPFKYTGGGQVTPEESSLSYEVFIQELAGGERPSLVATVLVTTSSGVKVLVTELGVELVKG